jgi:heat shock protein HtpX
MLNAPKEQIKATLAHEIGHIAHKDTDLILIVSIGNFIVTFIFIATRLFAQAMASFGGGDLNLPARFVDALLAALMWAWTKIGILLVMNSSREFKADKFAFKLGYGNALCELLDSFTGTPTKGLFVNLMNSHPDKNDRIAALMNLGVTYSKSYEAN